MTEENLNPGQQPPGQQSGSSKPEETAEFWSNRYKGASQKINELMGQIKSLQDQLAEKSSEIEQLRTQLSVKDVEKDTSISEFKKQLESALSQKSELEKETAELRAMKAKVEMAKKLNAPQLLPILETIPFVESEEALEVVMKNILDWNQAQVSEREKQLLAGVTPGSSSTPPPAKNTPKSREDWMKLINETPIGPEREALWQKRFEWEAEQARNQR